MAGRASGKKSGSGKKVASAKKARARPPAPVLGNDPFERGAAVRAGLAPSSPPAQPAAAPPSPAISAAALRQRLESLEQKVVAVAEGVARQVGELAGDEVAAQELREVLASLGPAPRDALGELRAVPPW